MRRDISGIFSASISAKQRFLAQYEDALIAAIDEILEAFTDGRKLLLFGNGGSAADAQHIAAELVSRFKLDRRGLPAIALTTDTSALTGIANDFGYEQVFARQIDALGAPGDVAIAISTSGNAPSVLRGVRECRRKKMTVIALTGGTGGRLAKSADIILNVSSTKETARIQETHILIGHVLCELVDNVLFGKKKPRRK